MPQGMERIEALLQAGADPNDRDALGETVLHKVMRAVGGALGETALHVGEGSGGTKWGAF